MVCVPVDSAVAFVQNSVLGLPIELTGALFVASMFILGMFVGKVTWGR